MKINNDPISKIMATYNNNKTAKKNDLSMTKENSKDSITISQTAKDFQFALKAINNIPDIREEKVEEIRRAINAGTYNISNEQVAEKIIQSSIFDIKA